jgi:type IV pilus assembly protein PilB
VIANSSKTPGSSAVSRSTKCSLPSERIVECYDITVASLIEDLHAEGPGAIASDDLHDIEVMANEPTVINLVHLIISAAVKEGASDIHVVPFEKDLELRYRIDGLLEIQSPPPKHLQAAVISRIKIMADMNIAERFIPQDGHFQIQRRGKRVDVRVGTMPTIYGESVVMRLLEKDSDVLSPTQLGLDDVRAAHVQQIVQKPHGIVLAMGPTGSGKTTTLYAVLSSIYTTTKKILTIEDPVEYELPGVGQIPVRPGRDFTFARGLRAILRQDPDIIMVGEIRDTETAEIAIRAALTGHLVFSTLHTNNAAGAVTRLLDMGIEPFLIASSLEAVLAQRLVRTICQQCRTPTTLSEDTAAKLQALNLTADGPFFHGKGCDDCRNTGYRGRTGLFELLVMRNQLRDCILDQSSSTEIQVGALKEMLTLREDGFRKVHEGITTMDEVLRVAMEDAELA